MTREERVDWLCRLRCWVVAPSLMTAEQKSKFIEALTETIEALQTEPCEDAISRKHFDERIRTAGGMVWDELSEDYKGAVCAILEMLKTEPSVQPQTEPPTIKYNADTIKQLRDMVADINCEEIFAHDDVTMPMWTSAWRERMFDLIDELPSVQPEPKTGRWEFVQRGKFIDICCSECGYVRVKEYAYNYTIDKLDEREKRKFLAESHMNFCECCGAKMIKSQESEGAE